jgi:hypothetical protein
MSQLLDRQEQQTRAGPDTMSGPTRTLAPVPSAEEVRAIVEGPPRGPQIRWMRWLGAFAVLVLAAGITMLVMWGGRETAQPEQFVGEQWFVSVDSPEFAVLPVEEPLNLPDNGLLMVSTTPHGVSFDFVVATQTPHGVSFDSFAPSE